MSESIARVTDAIKQLLELTMERDAYSVERFCARNSISKTTFYELQAKGQGPRTYKIGRHVLVAREDADAWRAARRLRGGQSWPAQ